MFIFDVCFPRYFYRWSIDDRYEFLKFLRTFRVRAGQGFSSILLGAGSRTRLTGVIFHSDTMSEGEGRSAVKRETKQDQSPFKRKRGSETSWLLTGEPDFVFGEHRRRPSREKPVIGR